jgi:hypothetical protein
MKFGGDVRLIRMSTDQQGGITYTYSNLTGFLANTPTQVQYFGDLSEASPFHNGATGEKHIKQEYYVGFAQDEWRVRPNLTLNYGLRYDYYAPLREADNRIVKFNIETGLIDPDTTPLYLSKKNSLQPRIGMTFSPTPKTVFRGGMGIFVGPGQTEDQIQPVEAERISTTVSSGPLNAYPVDVAASAPTSSTIRTPVRISRGPTPTSTPFRKRSTSTRRRCSGSSPAAWPRPSRMSDRRGETSSCAALPTGRLASNRTAPQRPRRFGNSTSSRATPTAASRPFSGRSPKSTTRPAAATTATTRCSCR